VGIAHCTRTTVGTSLLPPGFTLIHDLDVPHRARAVIEGAIGHAGNPSYLPLKI